MLEQLLEDELVDALGGLVVFFAVVNFVVAEVLSDEVREGLERLEPNVRRITLDLLDKCRQKLLHDFFRVGHENFRILGHLLKRVEDARSELLEALVTLFEFAVFEEVSQQLNHVAFAHLALEG